jgi:hypothetical protein
MKKSFLLLSIAAASSIFAASDVASAFKEGKVSGQIRYYFMDEDNRNDTRDYFGSALGGKLKYETASLNGLKAGAAFYYSSFLNDNISLSSTQSGTGATSAQWKNSRYVGGLVDSTDLNNRDVTLLGEAYLEYQISKTKATIGRMKLNTPLINPEDGRMIPTLEQGAWLDTKDIKNLSVNLGFLNAFAVRNTPEWKSVGNSLGQTGYDMGSTPLPGATAVPYTYSNGNTSSGGVYIASLTYTGVPDTKLEAWDYYVQNILNVGYLEGNYNKKLGDFMALAGAQYMAEQEVGNGGNDADNATYGTQALANAAAAKSLMRKGERSESYGAKIGFGYKDSLLTLAATKITNRGRFIFPREWGKEPFFTFQKRERTEGSGGATAWLATYDQDFKSIGLDGLSTTIGYGKYYKPDVKNAILNKYGMPSYAQLNIDVFYKFKGALKGLELEYLFARKYATGETYETGVAPFNYTFKKVDMAIHNLILNYNF